MSDLKNLWQDGYDTAKKETADTIKQLQARCYPSKVIMIEDTGHYVSEKVNDHIEQLQALVRAARCPCCDDTGAYYDNMGEVCQCQWCYEKGCLALPEDKSDE